MKLWDWTKQTNTMLKLKYDKFGFIYLNGALCVLVRLCLVQDWSVMLLLCLFAGPEDLAPRATLGSGQQTTFQSLLMADFAQLWCPWEWNIFTYFTISCNESWLLKCWHDIVIGSVGPTSLTDSFSLLISWGLKKERNCLSMYASWWDD